MKPYEVVKIYMVSSGRLSIFIWVGRYKSVLGLSPRTSCLLSCYMYVSGSKFDKVFLALLHGVGRIYIVLCQLFCSVLTAEHYLTLLFLTSDHWKFENFPNSEIMCNCESHSFLQG